MQSLILFLTMLFQSIFAGPVKNQHPIVPKGQEFQHAATHRISMEDVVDTAGCSATAVGPHTLLTAGHCLVPSHTMKLDADEVKVLSVDYDDNDHLLVRVDETFSDFLPIKPRELQEGEVVHMWGNPGHSRDVYRIGIFEREEKQSDDEKAALDWFLMPGAPGDSGSGIMDEKGNIVGVLSVGNQSGEVGGYVLDFTPAQLAGLSK